MKSGSLLCANGLQCRWLACCPKGLLCFGWLFLDSACRCRHLSSQLTRIGWTCTRVRVNRHIVSWYARHAQASRCTCTEQYTRRRLHRMGTWTGTQSWAGRKYGPSVDWACWFRPYRASVCNLRCHNTLNPSHLLLLQDFCFVLLTKTKVSSPTPKKD